MDKKDERNLRIIETSKPEEKVENVVKPTYQDNHILKKLLKFHNEGVEKFSVLDLFRK